MECKRWELWMWLTVLAHLKVSNTHSVHINPISVWPCMLEVLLQTLSQGVRDLMEADELSNSHHLGMVSGRTWVQPLDYGWNVTKDTGIHQSWRRERNKDHVIYLLFIMVKTSNSQRIIKWVPLLIAFTVCFNFIGLSKIRTYSLLLFIHKQNHVWVLFATSIFRNWALMNWDVSQPAEWSCFIVCFIHELSLCTYKVGKLIISKLSYLPTYCNECMQCIDKSVWSEIIKHFYMYGLWTHTCKQKTILLQSLSCFLHIEQSKAAYSTICEWRYHFHSVLWQICHLWILCAPSVLPAHCAPIDVWGTRSAAAYDPNSIGPQFIYSYASS